MSFPDYACHGGGEWMAPRLGKPLEHKLSSLSLSIVLATRTGGVICVGTYTSPVGAQVALRLRWEKGVSASLSVSRESS